jgi:hypothetical protein
MRHAAAALVLVFSASSALAQDEGKEKEMESQSQIADRIVAEQQGLKIQEVDGVMSATARAFAPIEGGTVQAPGGPGGESAAAGDANAAAAAAGAKKAKQEGGVPWGLVAGIAVSLAAVVVFVRAWRRAADQS